MGEVESACSNFFFSLDCSAVPGKMSRQDITFTYFGMKNQKFDVAAVCQTEGGPESLAFFPVKIAGSYRSITQNSQSRSVRS